MSKAFAIKGVALVLGLVAIWALPPGWGLASATAIAALTIGFFTYAIAHPRSQFFIPVVHRLDGRAPVVAFTFDDGPDPSVTPKVLDLLAAHSARATFFVVGARAARHPELIRRMHAEGHVVGTHTQHHRLGFHFGGAEHVRREIEDAVTTVAKLLPNRPTLFRPPQGLRTPRFAAGWRCTQGLTCVTWTVRALDSRPTTAAAIVARVRKRLDPGAIVTLHDGIGLGGGRDRTPTLAALETLLNDCAARGLRCVGLDALPSGSGASVERYPYQALLPAPIYWSYRGLRTLLVAFNFGAFWLGAVVLAWFWLPILWLWPGARAAKIRRSLRVVQWSFRAFHLTMRAMRLYHRVTPSATARPGGAPAHSPAVLVANHPTLCDVTSVVSLFPNVVAVARSAFADNPFMGRLLRLAGFVPTTPRLLAECEERLRMGFDVVIFPEGTRSPAEGGLQPFHRGAFELAMRARVPVVLLKLTCSPPALSKKLPIWKVADHMAVLTVEPIASIDPAGYSNSKVMCRAIERRYYELLGYALPPGAAHFGETE